MNFIQELTQALERGDKVRAMPRGDYFWRWVAKGEAWDFQRWNYEIVR